MGRRWRHYLNYAVLAVFSLLAGLLLYLATVRWLGHEFSRAALDLTHEQAEDSAHRLADALPDPARQNSLDMGLSEKTQRDLAQLVHQNPGIAMVLISDSRARIVFLVFGRTSLGARLHGMLGDQLPRGVDETTLVSALERSVPGMVIVRKPLTQASRARGALVVFVDASLPQSLVERATLFIGRDLLPIMLIAVVLGGAMLWLLQHQRHLSDRLREQRDQAESLAHTGTLAAGLAHEIRNPVNALAMQLDMLEEDLPERPEIRTRLERIRGGLSNLERTVNDFLNYAMPEKPQPGMIHLAAEVATQARGLEQPIDGPPPDVQVRVPEGLMAWGDPHAWRQIIGNLITNAQRAQRASAAPRILIEAYVDQRWVVTAVEDAGPGLAPEHAEQVFECFFTTNPDGTGLGLPIARRLAQMNGGTLTYAGRGPTLTGARFELRLPRTAQ